MKLRSAEAFCRVVELGGIVPAAEAMFCVPSNITKMIKELESELREPLFDRYKGRLSVTPFGKQYYQDVSQLLELSDKIHKKHQKGADVSTLTIGAIDVAIDFWLPRRVVGFMQENSHIRVNLINAYSRVLEEKLINRQLDMIFSDGPILSPEVTSALAFEERLVLVGHPERVNASPIPLYSFGKECLYSDMVERWHAEQPAGKYQMTQMESYQTMLLLAENNFGIGFIPERVLGERAAEKEQYQQACISCNVYLAWHRFIKHKSVANMLDYLQVEY
ncbi:LysR family transcriptional regulator [Erwinia sp. ErVv1]|uniref:LysR family transcriptional regulator n=1 Tax=Erwinia sp. ErVv1 TaxID=1603299 RepID=UPI00083110BB|nr:LysR family transcriptional regulator [Erwinia sp. ErVv1]